MVIEKRNDVGLFSDSAPSLRQLLGGVFGDHVRKLLDIALAQHGQEVRTKLRPQPRSFGLPDTNAIEGRMLQEKVDEEPARGLHEERSLHGHLIAISRVALVLPFD